MADDQPAGEVLIVTGMSGAGRTTAANALEDLDWYVVDNLPPQMLGPLLELTEMAGGALPKIAAVVDVRGRELFRALPAGQAPSPGTLDPGLHGKRRQRLVIHHGSARGLDPGQPVVGRGGQRDSGGGHRQGGG